MGLTLGWSTMRCFWVAMASLNLILSFSNSFRFPVYFQQIPLLLMQSVPFTSTDLQGTCVHL